MVARLVAINGLADAQVVVDVSLLGVKQVEFVCDFIDLLENAVQSTCS